MNPETKQCQNCKQNFQIEEEDFVFYEKMKVPPPTFCPECRFQRRLMFRNERTLYKRRCDLCGKDMVTAYSPDKPHKVYCNPCWWSDKWDGIGFGREYDPSRNFFEQFQELQRSVPYMALVVDYPTMINSEYVNYAGHLKNCYWSFNADPAENVHYSTLLVGDKDSMDSNMLIESELCYGDINCSRCSRTFFSEDCANCVDVFFSKNLIGCNNCFGCTNLRNKSCHIFNQPYSREEYNRKLKELRLDSFMEIQKTREEVKKNWEQHPHKFMHEQYNTNTSGDYVFQSKNAHDMYQVVGVEDGRFCQFLAAKPSRDVYDFTEWGSNAQRIYECATVGDGVDSMRFSFSCWRPNSMDVEYSMYVMSSAHMFGCVSLRNKQYCILNKQYSKEEYEKLREKIIQDMNTRPYTDAKGRVFKYGEFFPYDLSHYGYNETTAMEYFSLSKEKILENGWRWREPTPSEYKITLKLEDIPDSILDVQDSIMNEVLECSACHRAYRIIKPELELLRRFGLPIPRKCPECRHKERFGRINPPRLWSRACAKCGKGVQTSYAPERPEKIYCTECYNSEVV